MRQRIIASIIALAPVGCTSAGHSSRTDLVATGIVGVEVISSDFVILPPPHIYRDGDALLVSGLVGRKPGVEQPLDGHIGLLIVRPDGTEEEEIPLAPAPNEIPTTGNRQSKYEVRYAWSPPRGTVFRVLFDDKDHIALDNYGTAPNAGGRPAQAPSGIYTPSAAGHPRTGMARRTPGTPRQARSSPRTPGVRGGRR